MVSSDSNYAANSVLPLALVTGAAHRLGKAIAICLARQGFGIVLHYNNSRQKVDAVVQEIQAFGVPAYPIQADLRDRSQLQALFTNIDLLFEKTDSRPLSLRVLVNSAAVMMPGDAKNISIDEFDATIDLNLRAPFFCAQMAYQRMTSGGLIVNISDIAAQKAWTGYPVYTVSKAGLDSMTKVLARAFAPRVRVNAIAPGLALAPDNISPEEWNRLVKRLPGKREASLDELCITLEFLLKNEYITGQTVVIDGGYSLL
jgi:pteridine reductase